MACDVDAEIARLLELGARPLARHETWVTLADPEGNEFDLVQRLNPDSPYMRESGVWGDLCGNVGRSCLECHQRGVAFPFSPKRAN